MLRLGVLMMANQRDTLGMVESLHSAYNKFLAESVSERIFKLS